MNNRETINQIIDEVVAIRDRLRQVQDNTTRQKEETEMNSNTQQQKETIRINGKTKVIDGVLYEVETAQYLGRFYHKQDSIYDYLYITPEGDYFLYTEADRLALADNDHIDGLSEESIIPLTAQQAKHFADHYLGVNIHLSEDKAADTARGLTLIRRPIFYAAQTTRDANKQEAQNNIAEQKERLRMKNDELQIIGLPLFHHICDTGEDRSMREEGAMWDLWGDDYDEQEAEDWWQLQQLIAEEGR